METRIRGTGRGSLVNEATIGTILRHIQAEKLRATLLGTDESDQLSSLVSEAFLSACAKRFGKETSFAELLRVIGS